jgi:hypothetical protein
MSAPSVTTSNRIDFAVLTDQLASRIAGGSALRARLERLAHSELRAVERAIEILERSG